MYVGKRKILSRPYAKLNSILCGPNNIDIEGHKIKVNSLQLKFAVKKLKFVKKLTNQPVFRNMFESRKKKIIFYNIFHYELYLNLDDFISLKPFCFILNKLKI